MAFVKMMGLHGTIKNIPQSMVQQKLAIGYTLADKEETKEPEKVETEMQAGYDVTKPVSKWTKEELLTYAKDNGIDISGMKKGSEVAQAVAEHLKG